MLVIRFLRKGKKNQAFFRIVVTEKTNPPRGGRFLELLGFYNPLTKEKKINSERVKYWLSQGAQLSATVYNLLISEKIIEGKKIPVQAKAKKKEETEEAKEVKQEKPEEETTKQEKPKEEKPKEEAPKEEPKKEEPVKEEPPKEEPKEEPEEEAKS